VTSNARPSSAQIPLKFQQAIDCLQRGQLASAQALCTEILKQQPNHVDALHASGLIALQTNDPRKALELIGKALALNPGNAAAHCNRGSALQALNDLEAALESYNQAIVNDPRFAEAYFNRGIVLHLLKRPDDALASHSRAIALNSGFAAAYYQRGRVLQELNQLQAALASFDRAVAIDTKYAEAYLIRGNVQRQLGQWHAALASFDAAISIQPNFAEAHCNRGNILNELNQLDAAVASYDRAIAINDRYVEAYCNKAVAQLLAGDLDNGWINYEWRRKRHARNFSQPLWQGKESIAGKSILLHSEQGFGDTLQFCRYVPLVSALGAQVIFEVDGPLMSVMASLEGVSCLVEKGGALPSFDYQCPLLTLPLAFKTRVETTPASARYLRADTARVERWQGKLGERTKPRIGLVWAGSTVLNNNRSIELADWIPHIPSGFDYVCLQKEVRPEDRSVLRAHPRIASFPDEVDDFGDTAALCECMDLVISIDTSVAHLSGALGRKTWILLPFNPDWRWLLNRDDSPWYPSVTLYRQAKLGDWSSVLETVNGHLIQAFPSHGAP
jgi:tetratricopeptide (TPR) repeat protein